jgi:hypothetical protein
VPIHSEVTCVLIDALSEHIIFNGFLINGEVGVREHDAHEGIFLYVHCVEVENEHGHEISMIGVEIYYMMGERFRLVPESLKDVVT